MLILGLEELERVFDRRNRIVHYFERPFDKFQEVDDIMEFFQKVILNLSIEASRTYLIPVDFLGFHAAWMGQEPPAG